MSLDYIYIPNPLTFEDILILWVGEKVFETIKKEGVEVYLPEIDEEGLALIGGIENQLDVALINNHISMFHKRHVGNHALYYKVPYNRGQLAEGIRMYEAELHKCYLFMWHHPDLPTMESEPVYFDSREIFHRFPFLDEKQLSVAPSPSENTTESELLPLNIPPSLWAGKTPDVACQNLKEHGFDNSIIVYIIREKLGKSKVEAGRYAFGEVVSKGNEKENSTYSRTTDQYIKEVTSRYKLTFNDDANKIQ